MSELLLEARSDALEAELEARRRRRANAARYAVDPVLWMDDCVWIASRIEGAEVGASLRQVKMRVWPDQALTIGTWLDLERLAAGGGLSFGNVLVEKSRQIGETWALAALMRWLLRYHRSTGLYMHTQGGEVYDRDLTPRSFFGRIKYIDDHLDDRNELVFRPFSKDPCIARSAEGGVLYGELQRDDPGRGGTFDFVAVDEAAHVTHGESVHSALTMAAPEGRLYLSTPWGDDNFHARLCDDRPKGWSYLRLHWSTHPVYSAGLHVAGEALECELCEGNRAGLKWSAADPRAHRYPGKLTSAWYDQAVLDKTDEQVASELDIDRAGALTARVYGEFERGVHEVAGGVPYREDVPVELGWDFGLDCTAVPVIQNTPMCVNVIGLFEAGDKFKWGGMPEQVALGLREYLQSIGVPLEAVWTGTRCVGDPSGAYRDQTSAGLFAAYREQGFHIQPPPKAWRGRVDYSVTSVKNLLLGRPKPVRVCGVNGREFSRHMLNNVWPTDREGNRKIGVGNTQPLDNLHNHACRAFAYWAVSTFPPAGGRKARGRSAAGRRLPETAGIPGRG